MENFIILTSPQNVQHLVEIITATLTVWTNINHNLSLYNQKKTKHPSAVGYARAWQKPRAINFSFTLLWFYLFLVLRYNLCLFDAYMRHFKWFPRLSFNKMHVCTTMELHGAEFDRKWTQLLIFVLEDFETLFTAPPMLNLSLCAINWLWNYNRWEQSQIVRLIE